MTELTVEQWGMILAKAGEEIKGLRGTGDRLPEPDKQLTKFKKELCELINRCSLESSLEMPDFVMAELLTNFLKALQVSHAKNNCWHEMEAYSKDKEVITVC